MNSAYRLLTSKNKFWAFKVPKEFTFPELDTSAPASGNDGDAYISEPANSLFVQAVWDKTSDKMLDFKDHIWYLEQAGRADSDSESAANCWTPYNKRIYLYPTLNGEYNFVVYFRKRIDDMTGSETTIIGEEWDYPILMLATIRALMTLRQFDKAKEWRDEFLLTVRDLMGMQKKQGRYSRDRLIPSSQSTQRHGY